MAFGNKLLRNRGQVHKPVSETIEVAVSESKRDRQNQYKTASFFYLHPESLLVLMGTHIWLSTTVPSTFFV